MKRTYPKYQGYRGRSTANEKLRVVAVVLFILVLLAGAALAFGQPYILYTDSGIRVDLPFLAQEKTEAEDGMKFDVLIESEGS